MRVICPPIRPKPMMPIRWPSSPFVVIQFFLPARPTYAVAEWSLTMALAMNRGIFDLGRAGKKNCMTTKGLEGQRIGIIGFGRIGGQITRMLKEFRTDSVSYYSRHRHQDAEKELSIQYKE